MMVCCSRSWIWADTRPWNQRLMGVTEKTISECIGHIYQAAYDQAAWVGAVDAMRGLFLGSKACLVRAGPDRHLGDIIASGGDPAFQARYMTEFGREPNIVEATVSQAPVGLVYSDVSIIGKERLRRSRLWNEWMAPQDMYGGLTVKLNDTQTSSWFFDVQRGRNKQEFTASDAEMLKVITPHLRRAIELSISIGQANLFSSILQYMSVGVLAIDRSQRVISLNGTAEQILTSSESGLALRRGRLVASDSLKNARLQQLIAAACAARDRLTVGGDILFGTTGVNGAPMLSVSIAPAGIGNFAAFSITPCAMVILSKITPDLPGGFAGELQRIFDLTPREAGIAVALMAGRSLKDIANDAGIQFSTARTHLERIFRKTGARQQSQLVAVLKNLQMTQRRG